MEDFYEEIIKNENLFFKRVKLGASISEVENIEGGMYRKKQDLLHIFIIIRKQENRDY